MNTLIHYLRKMSIWLLPYHCLMCAAPSTLEMDLCEPCLLSLPRLPAGCVRCSRPLANAQLICGECLRNPPVFDVTYTLFAYKPPITHFILDLKFQEKLIHAKILGHLLAQFLKEKYAEKPLPELIIPMPLHKNRLKERGFNQVLEIARPVASLLNLPIDIYSAKRIRATAPQATLALHKRQQNLANAFVLEDNFFGKHVAVLDDVITSGNTIAAFCTALKAMGTKKIDVWCCARPIMCIMPSSKKRILKKCKIS